MPGPRPAKFRQVDITRAVRAVQKCGVAINRVEIDSAGKIVIVSDSSPEPQTTQIESDYEVWKRKQKEKQARKN